MSRPLLRWFRWVFEHAFRILYASPVLVAPPTVNGRHQVSVPAGTGVLFYRLAL